MAGEQPRNPGEQKTTAGQPLNQYETDSGQPTQVEGDDGTINYGPEQTAVGLIDRELPPVLSELLLPEWSELGKLKTQLRNNLRDVIEKYLRSRNITNRSYKVLEKELVDRGLFLDIVASIRAERTQETQGAEGTQETQGAEETERLETITEIAFRYIRLLRIDDNRYQQLAGPVVEIAEKLQQAVDRIKYSQKFLFETNKEFLEGLISHIVKLILSINKINSYDSRFRGRKPEISPLVHPNNALLGVLDSAAYALLNEAAKRAKELNNLQVLIDVINGLPKMIQSLYDDEKRPISEKIDTIRGLVMEMVNKNRNIDDNLIEQIERIIGQDTEDSLEKLIN